VEIKVLFSPSDEVQAVQLQKKCDVKDLSMDTSLNCSKDLPPFYECYENGKLVSFLTLFFPHEGEVEATAFTDPAFRGQGFFGLLVKKAAEQSLRCGFQKMIFAIEGESESGKAAVKHFPASYSFSEYAMKLDSVNAPVSRLPRITLEKATEELYAQLESEPLIQTPQRIMYIAMENGRPVGHAALCPDGDDIWIYHLCIASPLRGKGLGESLMRALIEEAHPRKPILEVDRNNIPALSLYRKLGFKPVSTMDYFSMDLRAFKEC
jgi:GNAT superfamily N-acetyltransferase